MLIIMKEPISVFSSGCLRITAHYPFQIIIDKHNNQYAFIISNTVAKEAITSTVIPEINS